MLIVPSEMDQNLTSAKNYSDQAKENPSFGVFAAVGLDEEPNDLIGEGDPINYGTYAGDGCSMMAMSTSS